MSRGRHKGSEKLVQDAVILMWHMRTEHVPREDDLVESARYIEVLKQPYLVYTLLRLLGSVLGAAQTMSGVKVRIAQRPQNTPWGKELRHVHVGFERLAHREELRGDT